MRAIRATFALAAGLVLLACSTELRISPPDGGPIDGGGDDAAVLPPTAVLAAGLEEAAAVAVDAQFVYFTRATVDGAILRVSKAGGAITTLETGDLVNTPTAIATAAASVYWVARGASGGALPGARRRDPVGTVTHSSNGATPEGLAVAGGAVFWLQPALEQFVVSDLVFSKVSNFTSTAVPPRFVAANASHVYGATKEQAGQVFRSSHDGSAGVTLGGSYGFISALAVSTSTVAWAGSAGVFRADTAAFTGAGTTISTLSDTAAIVVEDAPPVIYFLTVSGELFRRPDNMIPELLVGPSCKQGRGLAQDADALYLACGSSIHRIAKKR